MRFTRVLVVIVLFLCYLKEGCFATTPPPDIARITMVKGGSPMFVFNVLDKYLNGIVLSNYTEFKVYFEVNNPLSCKGWSFTISTSQSEILMSGGAAGFGIPLKNLVLKITVDGVVTMEKDLSAPIVLFDIDNTNTASHVISITYSLGSPPDLVTLYPSGFYYVDLSLDLFVKPNP